VAAGLRRTKSLRSKKNEPDYFFYSRYFGNRQDRRPIPEKPRNRVIRTMPPLLRVFGSPVVITPGDECPCFGLVAKYSLLIGKFWYIYTD
jgi:hypothetical protein